VTGWVTARSDAKEVNEEAAFCAFGRSECSFTYRCKTLMSEPSVIVTTKPQLQVELSHGLLRPSGSYVLIETL